MSFSTASRAGLSGDVGRMVRATVTAMAVAKQSTIVLSIAFRFTTDLLRKTRCADGSNCAKPRPTDREQLSLQNVFGRCGDNESALFSGNLWKQLVREAP